MRCALSASTLSWNSRSNPLVTPSTTTKEATPNTTPIVETVVKTEKVRSRNATTAVSPPASTPSTAAVSIARERPCARENSPNPTTISATPTTSASLAPRDRRPRCR